MTDQPVTLFCFGGRRENLELQLPFIRRILSDRPDAQYHLWNLTRNASDDAFVRSLHDPDARIIVINDLHQGKNDWPIGCRKKLARPRWCGCDQCRPAPFEEVYHWYAKRDEYTSHLFTKLDDDVVFIETDRFSDLLAAVEAYPNAVASAAVVNNVVGAKHMPALRTVVESVFGETLDSQKAWFDLHADDAFARVCHEWFFENWREVTADRTPAIERALPGERPSINTIAFNHDTMRRLSATMRNPRFRKSGDEGTVCSNFLPRIVTSFVTAHLYFGPQRVGMDDVIDAYREQYAAIAAEYLA